MLLVLFCHNLRTFYSGEKGIFAGATRVLKKVQSAANCYQTTFVVMTSFFKGSTQCSLCFVFIWNQLIFSTYICNYSNKEHHHKQFFSYPPAVSIDRNYFQSTIDATVIPFQWKLTCRISTSSKFVSSFTVPISL